MSFKTRGIADKSGECAATALRLRPARKPEGQRPRLPDDAMVRRPETRVVESETQ